MELFDRFCRGQDMIVRQLDGAVVFGNPSPERKNAPGGERFFATSRIPETIRVWWYFVGLKNG